ncbi:MAG TPA: transposase [Thermoanaerobaculia bacterium]|nr:transposase [Thermoanaerobaculia bacterium]
MPDYRRAYIPGGTFFFTVVTEQRARFLCTESARTCLRTVLQECRKRWPFKIDAFVLLHDHLHAIWTLPEKDTDYSKRWGWIKKEFSKLWLANGGNEQVISRSRRRRKRYGVWQRGFWEHAVISEHDFARHFDYIHYNPVKHGIVSSVRDWPFSSFHRWVELGVYSPGWGAHEDGPLEFPDLDTTAME